MTSTVFLDKSYIAARLPARKSGGAKWDHGRLLAVCGSAGMPGAAALCCGGALRSGAGLVRLASVAPVVQATVFHAPECTFCLLPQGESGAISAEALPLLLKEAARASAVLCGCGLSLCNDTATLLEGLVQGYTGTLVLDADALTLLSRDLSLLRQAAGQCIVTPHAVEMARLLGCDPAQVFAHPAKAAAEFAAAQGVTVVLKGSDTYIASPGQPLLCNRLDNTGLAKGGSGDVLAGLIAGLAAQGAAPYDAAAAGVFLHSQAGAAARAQKGEYAMLPRDVIACIPDAFRYILG